MTRSRITTNGLADASVTYVKIQNIPENRLLGRSSSGTGVVEEIVCSAFSRSILDDADAATMRTTLGLAAVASTGSAADLTGTLPTASLPASVVTTDQYGAAIISGGSLILSGGDPESLVVNLLNEGQLTVEILDPKINGGTTVAGMYFDTTGLNLRTPLGFYGDNAAIAAATTRTNIGAAAISHQHVAANITDFAAAAAAASPEEVIEYATPASFPATGNTSLIYIATDSSRMYRWTGSQYVETGPATTFTVPHEHNAGDVTAGVFLPARLGSGTASSATFLKGDNAWYSGPVEEFIFTTTTGPTTATNNGIDIYVRRNWVWEIPATAKFVRIIAVGGGGGGGSGRRGASGTARYGGGGGGGGGVVDIILPVSSLPTRLLGIDVPFGGVGGAAVTADDTNGNNGLVAYNAAVRLVTSLSGTPLSTFAFIITTDTGGRGLGGTAAAGTGGTGGIGGGSGGSASGGGSSSVSATAGIGGEALGCTGGGGGGGISTANSAFAGGLVYATTYMRRGDGTAQADGGSAGGGNGAQFAKTAADRGFGGGGGGGNAAGSGGNGASGTFPGGGGGGGGASVNGFNSGAGGNGADGVVRITVWY